MEALERDGLAPPWYVFTVWCVKIYERHFIKTATIFSKLEAL